MHGGHRPPVTEAVKQKAIDLVSSGMLHREAAEALGVSRRAVGTWCQEAGVERPKPDLMVLWAQGTDDVRLPIELEQAMTEWRERVERSTAEAVMVWRSSIEADGTRRSA